MEMGGEGAVAAVTLFKQDTVLSALGVMQRLGCAQLPVRDQSGVHVGDVTEEELYRWWARAPLTRIGKVLEARWSGDVPAPRLPRQARREPLFRPTPRPAQERGWTH